jgi:2-C-methyl-D-erythritol 4-phosphate cytidylyltransferase
MISYSLRSIAASVRVTGVILVVPGSDDRWAEEARRVAGAVDGLRLLDVVPGGATRDASVRAGLDALPSGAELVLCHDAARPFAPPALFDRVVDALTASRATDRRVAGAVPVIPSLDTVKLVRSGRIVGTVAREEVALAQTPQAFDAASLVEAHRRPRNGIVVTDDAMLLEAAGFEVVAVPGETANVKVTTADDLRRADLVARGMG